MFDHLVLFVVSHYYACTVMVLDVTTQAVAQGDITKGDSEAPDKKMNLPFRCFFSPLLGISSDCMSLSGGDAEYSDRAPRLYRPGATDLRAGRHTGVLP